MIRNFFSTPNVVGKLMIALLFVGGVVFAGAFDGFVVEIEASGCCGGGEIEASGCCGGGTDASIFSSSECCAEECSTCTRPRCPKQGCSSCRTNTYNCSTSCGQCSCLPFCGNAKSKACPHKDGVCTVKP